MSLTEKIKSLENEIAKTEALISPLRQLNSELTEQIRLADESFAYTGKMDKVSRGIVIYTSKSTIAEVNIGSRSLIQIIQESIDKKTEVNKGSLDKLEKIKSILND